MVHANPQRLFSRRGAKADQSAQPAEGSTQKLMPSSTPEESQEGAEHSPSSAAAPQHSPEASTESNLELNPEPKGPLTGLTGTTDTTGLHHSSDAQSSASAQSNEKGQVPSPSHSLHQSNIPSPSTSTSTPLESQEMSPTVATSDSEYKEKEKHRKSSSATYTLTVPLRGHRHSRKDNKSTSDATTITSGHPSLQSTTQQSMPLPKNKKMTFLSRITHLLTSCVHLSKNAHVVDLDEGATHTPIDQKDSEKRSATLVDSAEQQPSREPSTSTTGMSTSYLPSSITDLIH